MDKIDFVNAQKPALNDENLNKMQDNIERAINAQVSGDTLPIGSIMSYSSDNIPENWLLADGQEVSRTEYNHLFAVIGIMYGDGDGSTTFNLPNLCGKVIVGQDENDSDFYGLGNVGGEKEHTLVTEEIPSHTHTSGANTDGFMAHRMTMPSGEYKIFENTTQGEVFTYVQPSSAGGGQAHNNLQPYMVQNYIIKAKQSAGIVATVVDSLESKSETDALSARKGKEINDKINGVTVYKSSGSKENITLTENTKNAKFMEIYYKDQEDNYGYIKIDNPFGKKVTLTIASTNSEMVGLWLKTKSVQIDETQITNKYHAEGNVANATVANVNFIFITKVVLYF